MRLRNRETAAPTRPIFLMSDSPLEERKALDSEPLSLAAAADRVFRRLPFELMVHFTIYNRNDKVSMYLSHRDSPSRDSLISGFPRCLLSDDVIAECKADYSHLI